jgi:uncharacterized protein
MFPSFKELAKDIIYTDGYQRMKNYNHHKNVSCYKHSIRVAYACYLYYIKKKPKYDIKDFVWGALLHDYYLYDWHNTGEGHRLHGFRHPKFALKNAKRDFNVTPLMEDIILHHMFPLVPILPKSKAAFRVSIIDKKIGFYDYKKKRSK